MSESHPPKRSVVNLERSVMILASGPHSTVQDMGRLGHQALGVPEGGALDKESLRLANILVGNSEDSAAFEIGLGGMRLVLDCDAKIALTGTLEGRLSISDGMEKAGGRAGGRAGQRAGERAGHDLAVPSYRSFLLKAGRSASLGMLTDSNNAIIAISGGVETPRLYGSMSTSPNAMIGGLDGRVLQAGDRLALGEAASLEHPEVQIKPLFSKEAFAKNQRIRVVLGPQDDRFTEAAVKTLGQGAYRVTPALDRMGMRLDGPPLSHIDGADIASDGVVAGTIQVPGDGQPIILLADHQTTGGYTKIATVISADMASLVRVRPGQAIRFEIISIDQAEHIARTHAQAVQASIASQALASPLLDMAALYDL